MLFRSDKNVGTGKTVSASGIVLAGTDAGNYNLTSTTGSGTGTITPKALTIVGMSAVSKVYDGNTKASVTGGSISGLVGSETLGVTGLTVTFDDKNAGTGKSVTATGTTLVNGGNGGLASNYTMANPTGFTANITPKALTVIGMTAGSKVYDGTTAATLSGGTLSGLISGESLLLTGGTGVFADKNAGTGKSVIVTGTSIANGTGGLASNYTVTNPTTVTGTITAKALTLLGVIASDKTYDGTTIAQLTGGTLDGLIGTETLTVSTASGTFVGKDAGSGKTVTFTGATLANAGNGATAGLASNYTVNSASAMTASIAQKALTVTGATAADKVYDGSVNTSVTGGTLNGLVGGETIGLSGMSGTFADKNAGTGKDVTVSGATLTNVTGLASNYTVSNPTGVTANVTKATISSVTGIIANDKVYDGNTKATAGGTAATFNGMVVGDSLSFTAATGTFADKNAGTGKTVAVSGIALGGTDAGNYNLTTTTGSGTGTITPKALTITGMTAVGKVYDGSTKATLSGGSISGLVGLETLGVTGLSATFDDKNAGAGKTVTASGSTLVNGGNGGLASNYTIANPTGLTANITPKALTVTGMTAGSKVYDGTTAATLSGGTLSGLISGESLLLGGGTGVFADKNAGTGKSVIVTGTSIANGTGGLASNYTVTNPTTVTGTITAKALTLLGVIASDKTYDGTTIAQLTGGTLDGLIGTETLTVSTASGTFADKNAGSGKSVTFTGATLANAGTGTTAGLASNYTVNSASAMTASIAQKALTVTGATAADKVYDGSVNTSVTGGTLNGLVGGETIGLSGMSGTFADKNAGTGKDVTVSGATLTNVTGLASNYTVSNPTGVTANVTKATISSVTGIIANDKVYDGNTKATAGGTAATFNGMVVGDSLSFTAATGTFADKNAGTGKTVAVSGIALAGTDAGNYNLTTTTGSGTGTITPKALTITGMTAVGKVYDGSTKATLSGGSISGLVGLETLGVTGLSATFDDKNAGTGKTVTASGSTLVNGGNGGLASNYTIANPTGLTANITPKALTVTGMTAGSKVYDGTTAATLSGGTLNGLISGESLLLGGSTGVFADKNAGGNKTVTVTGSTLADGTGGLASNYTVTNPTTVTGTITAKALTLLGVVASDKTYDGTTAAQLTGGTLDGLVGSETLAVTTTSGTFSDKNAGGGKTVTFTGATLANAGNGATAGLASNYTVNSASAMTASIAQKALTVTGATAADKVYDGSVNTSVTGGTLNGLVGAETLTLSGLSGMFADKNAGTTKVVTATGATLADGTGLASNYTVNNPTGLTGTITAKALTVSGVSASDKVYDGNAVATLSGGKLNGLVAGETLGISGQTGTFDDKNAANGKTVTVSGTTLVDGTGLAGNYTVSNPSTLTANITAKALTVGGMTAADKVYDGNAVATLSGGTLNGLVAGETLGISGQTGTFNDKNAANGKTVTVSGTTLVDGTGLASNYTVSNPSTLTANITPKALTAGGMTAADKVYDGNAVAAISGGALSGLVAGETLGISGQTGTFNDKNAANGKTVTVSGTTLVDGTGLASNYTVSNPAVLTANITAKALTVDGVTAADKVYDGNTVAALSGGTLNGLVAGESLGITGQTGTFNDKNAAIGKTVTVTGTTLVDGTGLASNYTVSNPATLTANITAKALTVGGVTAADKVYDGNAVAAISGGTLNGLVAGETLGITGQTGTFNDKNAANGKSVTVSGTTLVDGTGLASNYTVSNPATLTANIMAKALTVAGMTAADKVYDGNVVAAISGGSLSGLVAGETLGISGQTGTFNDKNAANGKTVTVSGTTLVDGTGLASNYTVSNPATLTANITAKALTVGGMTAADKVYDGNAVAALSGGTLNGLVAGETLGISGQAGTFNDKNAANGKTVTVSGTTLVDGIGLASNYTVSNPATLTANITAKALTVGGMTAADKVYDGNVVAAISGGSLSGLVAGETLGITGQTGTFNDKNAANGKTVTVSGTTLVDGTGLASNYSVVNPSALTANITQKALIVNGVTAADKVYDGSVAATLAGATLSGLVGNETLALNGMTGVFTDKNAGAGKTVNVSAVTLGDGTGLASNYTVTGPSSLTANISRATISSVSGISAGNKVYDGTTLASLNSSAASFNGMVAGDSLTVSNASGAFVDKNAAVNKVVNINGIALSGADAGNYVLANTAASTTATIAQANLLVTATGVNKVYDATTQAQIALQDNRIGNDVLTVAGSAAFADKNAGQGKAVNVSGISLGGADAGNYVANTTTTTRADIAQANLTVTVNDAAKVQGEVNPVFTAQYSGLLGADTLAAEVSGSTLFSTAATVASAAGDYTVAASGLSSTNYAVGYVDGTLSVAPSVAVAPPAAVQEAIAAAVGSATVVPSQGGMVSSEPVLAPEVEVPTTGAAPLIQVAGGTVPNPMPGLNFVVVDRGINLPEQLRSDR